MIVRVESIKFVPRIAEIVETMFLNDDKISVSLSIISPPCSDVVTGYFFLLSLSESIIIMSAIAFSTGTAVLGSVFFTSSGKIMCVSTS